MEAAESRERAADCPRFAGPGIDPVSVLSGPRMTEDFLGTVEAARAGAVTVYDFTGIGNLSVDGGFSTTPNVSFRGGLTFDVNAANQPAPTAQNSALALTGWVTPTFSIENLSLGAWHARQPMRLDGQTEFDTEALVDNNDAGLDRALTFPLGGDDGEARRYLRSSFQRHARSLYL